MESNNQKKNEIENQEYEELISQYRMNYKPPEVGELIYGRVVSFDDKYGIVDIGLKSEGLVPINQLKNHNGELKVSIGDEIPVVIESFFSGEDYIILSKAKADEILGWGKIKEAYEKQMVMEGEITQIVKGGVIVNSGYKVFIPLSLFDIRKTKDIENYLGQNIFFKIINIDEEKKTAIGSRRAVVEEQREEMRKKLLANLKEGRIVRGVVKNITDFGAFIDLGGADALLHRSDIEWDKDVDPSEVFKIGQTVKAKVIKFDPETGKISLGIKQMKADPWEKIIKKYSVGSVIKGKVTSLTDYGAFVEIKNGIHGMIHLSELSWDKKIKHPKQVLAVGDEVKAYILKIDEKQRRISLSLREVEPNPWENFKKKHPVGSRVSGTIKRFSSMGAFVELREGLEGFIHIKDMTWAKKAKPPSEIVKKGDVVTAEVLEVVPERKRIRLGLKQLIPNAWDEFFKKYKEGDIITGKITYVTDYGAFVEIENGIEGFLHISEISNKKINKPSDVLSIGQEVTAKIFKLNPEEKRISLSLKALMKSEKPKKKQEVVNYAGTSEAESSKVTIADIASEELRKLKNSQKKGK